MDVIWSMNLFQMLIIYFQISDGDAKKINTSLRMKRSTNPCPLNEPFYYNSVLGLCCPCSTCPDPNLTTHAYEQTSGDCIAFFKGKGLLQGLTLQIDRPICKVKRDSECFDIYEVPRPTATVAKEVSTVPSTSVANETTATDKRTTPIATPTLPPTLPPTTTDRTIPVVIQTTSPGHVSEESKSSLSEAHLSMVIIIAGLALIIISMIFFYCYCGRGLKKLNSFLKQRKKKKPKSKTKQPVEREYINILPEDGKEISDEVVEESEAACNKDITMSEDSPSIKREPLPNVGESFGSSLSAPVKTDRQVEGSSTSPCAPLSPKSGRDSSLSSHNDSFLPKSVKDAAFYLYQSTIGGSVHINIHPPAAPPPAAPPLAAPHPAPQTAPVVQQPLLQSGSNPSSPPVADTFCGSDFHQDSSSSNLNKKKSTSNEGTVPVRGTHLMLNNVPEALRRQAAQSSAPTATFLPGNSAPFSRQHHKYSPFSLRRCPQEHESVCYDQETALGLNGSQIPHGSDLYDVTEPSYPVTTTNRTSEIIAPARTRDPTTGFQLPIQASSSVEGWLNDLEGVKYPLNVRRQLSEK